MKEKLTYSFPLLGITFHETDEYTLYPASILSVTKNRFTKHYFIGSKRVASRIGSGSFNNMYGVNGSHVTAGQQDYAERLSQIESQKEDYYKKLGIAPGIPTMKGSYADPENTGVGYNTIIKELGDHSVPAEWAQYVKKNEQEGTAPGAPIAWDDPSDPDEAQPGYGFVADSSSSEEETYFFHSDHLGEYNTIIIPENIFSQYYNSQMNTYKGLVRYYGKDYSLPQDVFMDPQNWNSNGFQYSWPGSAFIRLNIVATHAVGKTIFWRPEKK